MDKQPRFSPPFYLKNRHIQSIMNSVGPRQCRARNILKKLRSETILLTAADGTRLIAELDYSKTAHNRLAILIHGWEGSSKSAYQITTTAALLDAGWDVLRVNLRDHGDSHALNRELFNSTRTPEVASALENFLSENSYRNCCLIGYSLGGSFALRIAADSGTALRLTCCIAISPPVNPGNAMQALSSGWFGYERYFYQKYRNSVRRKLKLFPDLDYQNELDSARTVEQLNNLLIPKVTAYQDINTYYAAYALTGDRLKNLNMPSYLVTAEDDPIIPAADLRSINSNPFLHIDLQKQGGHCGFIEDLSAHSWVENRIINIVTQFNSDDKTPLTLPGQSLPEALNA